MKEDRKCGTKTNRKEYRITYTAQQKSEYRNIGGTRFDGEHTVFGRVVRGMEIADRIAQTPTDDSDWPCERLEIEMVRNKVGYLLV